MFEFLNSFVDGNSEVFSNSKIRNDFTKSDTNLDFSVFFCMALPKPLQSKIEVNSLRIIASLWTPSLASTLHGQNMVWF